MFEKFNSHHQEHQRADPHCPRLNWIFFPTPKGSALLSLMLNKCCNVVMHRESCFLGFETGGGDVVDIAPSPGNLIFNVTHNFFSVHWNAHSGGVFILYVKQKVYFIIFSEFYIFLFSFWFIISNHCDFPPFEIHFSCLLCLNPCSNLKEYLHGPLLIDVDKCIGILREPVFWLKYSEQQHAEHLSIERGTPADF